MLVNCSRVSSADVTPEAQYSTAMAFAAPALISCDRRIGSNLLTVVKQAGRTAGWDG
ncbi:hypothetical protein ACNKHN_23590 [Shigella flexneri]